jgi:hypothetical protein
VDGGIPALGPYGEVKDVRMRWLSRISFLITAFSWNSALRIGQLDCSLPNVHLPKAKRRGTAMGLRKPLSGSVKIVVTFERRADGGLRAHSDDVPGFVLSHSDQAAVRSDVNTAW